MNDARPGRAPRKRKNRTATVSARNLWRAVAIIVVLGIAALLLLMWLWRDGRLFGVRQAEPAPGAVAAYSGMLPTGERPSLKSPRGMTVAGGRLYVAEPDASQVTVFSTAGRYVRTVKVAAPGRCYPIDVAVIGSTMYVVDTAGRRVLALPARGGTSRVIAPKLNRPSAVAVDDGKLVIADAAAGLWEYSAESGQLARSATKASRLGYVGAIAVTRDQYFVTQAAGSRVLRLPTDGSGATVFGERVNMPRGIARDGAGRVWVSDVLAGQVIVLDPEGSVLGDLENEPVISGVPAKITTPQGIAYSADRRTLFVSEADSGRVLVYTLAE